MSERRLRKRDEDRELVQWGSYDEAALEGHEEELSEREPSEFDKLETGRNTRRILPPPKGSGWGKDGADTPILTVWQHTFMVGDRMIKFACPQKEQGLPCFACEQGTRARRSAIPAEKDKGYELKAKRVAYIQWFDPTLDEPTIKVYEAGKTIRESLVDYRRERGDYSHPTKGYDIVIKRKGTTRKDTDYTVFPGDDSPLSDFGFTPEDLIDLESYINVPTEEEQEAHIDVIKEFVGFKESRRSDRRQLRSGRGSGEEDRPRRGRGRAVDEDEDDRGSATSRRRGGTSRKESPRRGRTVPRSYDPDDDSGEIIDVEPEREARPSRRAGRRRRS